MQVNHYSSEEISEQKEENRGPLKHLGVRQNRLDETTQVLVKLLLPLCSAKASAKAYLALSISSWGINQQVSTREISLAAEEAEKARGFLQDYLYEEIWMVYAAAQGIDGCLYAAQKLSCMTKFCLRNVSDLVRIAIDCVPQKEVFLRELWSASQSIREYA